MVTLIKQKTDIPLTFRFQIIYVDSGSQHTCTVKAITPTPLSLNLFQVGCWGTNTYGQSDTPSSFVHSSMIALGDYHTCAISTRMVACWGNNS